MFIEIEITYVDICEHAKTQEYANITQNPESMLYGKDEFYLRNFFKYSLEEGGTICFPEAEFDNGENPVYVITIVGTVTEAQMEFVRTSLLIDRKAVFDSITMENSENTNTN